MAIQISQIEGGLDGFLVEYGPPLGQKAREALAPRHVPGVHDTVPISIFKRKPFDPQAHVISAAVKALKENKSMIIVGEMGTGKTLIGQCIAHAFHTLDGMSERFRPWSDWKPIPGCPPELKGKSRSLERVQPGYRCLVFCPSHLIDKWKREILETIPNAHVYTFDRSVGKRGGKKSGADDSWKQVVRYWWHIRDRENEFRLRGKDEEVAWTFESDVSTGVGPHIDEKGVFQDIPYKVETRREHRMRSKRVARREAHWKKPQHPEFVIIGQGQAKYDSKWIGLGDPETKTARFVYRRIKVDRVQVKDAKGQPVFDKKGKAVKKWVTVKKPCCPRCGEPVRDEDGLDLSVKAMGNEQAYCQATYLQEVHDPTINPERASHEGLDMIVPCPAEFGNYSVGRVFEWNKRAYQVRQCCEPLWQWTKHPYKWAPARFMKSHVNNAFDFFLLDEMHEEKSDESAQSMAAGKLIAISKKVVGLTGTLIGGYANHLLPLLMRLCPAQVRAQGIAWGDDMAFAKKYGRIKTVITRRSDGEVYVQQTRTKKTTSMRKETARSDKQDNTIAPGIMPHILGDMLIGNTIFIGLGDMAKNLPPLNGNGQGEPVPLTMDRELSAAYGAVADVLEEVVKKMMLMGNMKLLGAMLHTLNDYPDHPYDWRPPVGCEGRPAVGYFDNGEDEERSYSPDKWVGIVQPPSLDKTVIREKEQRLIELCCGEKAEGRQVWVYTTQSGKKRDVQPRLQMLLERYGLRVGILRSSTVEPREREAWIMENGKKFDVIISHPKLVSTGLDLFDKRPGGHNFSTIVFYSIPFDLNLFRQASRRSWRIGQPLECRVFYLYYRGTMQERMVALTAKKLAAAQALEGKFSSEGLLAMAGEENSAMALARSLSEVVEPAERAWKKIGETKKVAITELVKNGTLDRLEEFAGMGDEEKTQASLVLGVLVDRTPEPTAEAKPDDIGGEKLAKMYLAMKKLGMSLDDLL